jgi:MFS family permease
VTSHGFIEECRGGGWKILLASLIGVGLGLTALPFYTIGVFAKPVSEAFGWSRAIAPSGILFSMFGTACAAGIAGALIDRHGARKVALVSQAGLAIGFLLFATQTGSPLLWRANWFLLAVFGVGTTPITWSRGIAEWFVRSRGFALGIALAGTGVTAFVAPPLVGAAIAAFGWRGAYVAIALAILLVGMPTVWLLFPKGGARALGTGQGATPGLTLGEALRGYRFWLILVSFAGISFGVGGAIPNLVPILLDQGIAEPALYASLLGANVILGRLLAGWLLDRFWAPAVAAGLLALPALACVLLAQSLWPAVAAALIGLAGGAEFDLIAYLTARYFGMRNYGRIYAWQWTGFSLAAGAGAWVFALSFDKTGSYAAALYGAAALMLGGGIALAGLGRYPTFRSPAEAGAQLG